MATSLEVRAPFLDADLVDWLGTLPSGVKRQGGVGKLLMKKALQGKLPPGVMNRPKKGFGIPVAAWLRGPLKGWMTDWLSADRLRRQGLFDDRYVGRLVDEHLKGVRDHRKPIWTLLNFQIWYDRWLDNPAAVASNEMQARP
jgi:asparagine synthase (glutamine-hydrolysing)